MTEKKRRNNTDGQQNHRNNDRDDQSGMWSCSLHLIITIGDSTNEHCTMRNRPLHLIIYIEDGEGISRIAEMGSGRHAETVTTVERWRRGGEESLGNVA